MNFAPALKLFKALLSALLPLLTRALPRDQNEVPTPQKEDTAVDERKKRIDIKEHNIKC